MKPKTILRPMQAVPQFTYGLRKDITPDGRDSAASEDIGCLDAPRFLPAGSMSRYEVENYAWPAYTEWRR